MYIMFKQIYTKTIPVTVWGLVNGQEEARRLEVPRSLRKVLQ